MGRRVAGAILAGGTARRYGGEEKGLIRLKSGGTIVDRLVAEMRKAGLADMAICSDRPEPYQRLGLPVLPDRHKRRGPLGGIESALRHFTGPADGVLFLPCDMPAISREEIGRLKEAFLRSENQVVVAGTGHFFVEPLCSVVHIDTREAVEKAMAEGRLRIRALWEELGAEIVRFEDDTRFVNINTPDEFEQFIGQGDK